MSCKCSSGGLPHSGCTHRANHSPEPAERGRYVYVLAQSVSNQRRSGKVTCMRFFAEIEAISPREIVYILLNYSVSSLLCKLHIFCSVSSFLYIHNYSV